MAKLPVMRPIDVLKKLEKFGFIVTRQTGSHARLIHSDGRATTVALHNRDLPKGTLRAILKQCEMSIEEFLKK
jgi:predicted RNA binding protein YcfA (HicA-like mRNA interferase family)